MGQNIGLDALAGAIAGAVGTLAMGMVTNPMYARENRLARWQEDRARGGKSADEIAAGRVADLIGVDLSRDQEAMAGTAVHYGLGVSSGAAYGVVRRHILAPPVVRGLGFGATLWLIADEGANPALGITPGPAAFPWQTHARGLVAHLVLGLVTEGVLSLADRFQPQLPTTPEGRNSTT